MVNRSESAGNDGQTGYIEEGETSKMARKSVQFRVARRHPGRGDEWEDVTFRVSRKTVAVVVFLLYLFDLSVEIVVRESFF